MGLHEGHRMKKLLASVAVVVMLVVGAVPPTVADSGENSPPGAVVTEMTGGGDWGYVNLGSIPAGTIIRVTYDSMIGQPWDLGEAMSYLWVSEDWDYGWLGREWITYENLEALNLNCHVFVAHRDSVDSYDPDEESWKQEPLGSYSTHSGCDDWRSHELTPVSDEYGERWYGFSGEYTFEVRDFRGWSPDSVSISFEHMYWTFEIVSVPDVLLPTAPRYEGVCGMPWPRQDRCVRYRRAAHQRRRTTHPTMKCHPPGV